MIYLNDGQWLVNEFEYMLDRYLKKQFHELSNEEGSQAFAIFISDRDLSGFTYSELVNSPNLTVNAAYVRYSLVSRKWWLLTTILESCDNAVELINKELSAHRLNYKGRKND